MHITNRLERRVARKAITELLDAGYLLGVYDGEETTLKRSSNPTAVMKALFTTDEDYLLTYKPALDGKAAERCGWVRFVYGNSGYDVICDYTTNLEDALKPVNAFADKLDLQYCR